MDQIGPGSAPKPVREFGSGTAELVRMTEWCDRTG
jgi:hypothetical protein